MMTIDEMKRIKKALGLTNQQLAEKSGVPLATVAKVLSQTTKSPRINTLLALEKALTDGTTQLTDGSTQLTKGNTQLTDGTAQLTDGSTQLTKGNTYHTSASRSSSIAGQYPTTPEGADFLVQEPSGDYLYGSNAKKDSRSLQETGKYDASGGLSGNFFHTVEDYLALPDERRAELIDGRFYDMASPNGIHQQITFMLWRAFFDCIEAHSMPCKVQGAPFDVQLDTYTVVQPDVMVFCEDPSQAFAVRATTPPDLVVEVLSRSTAFKDRHLKLFKYRYSGVREVWLVSPDDKRADVYLFTKEDETMKSYSFDDKIPVHISQGKCVIDFAEIRKRLPSQ